MFRNLAEDIAFLLIKHKILDIEQRDIYIYGLEVILLNGGLVLMFLTISLLFGVMINFWAYLIFFLPIRIFSGGYHAKTSERCFVLSTVMYGLSIALTKFIPLLYTLWEWRIAGIVSLFVILVMAPLINENNPLSKTQRKRNRIIVYILLVLDLAFFILSCNYVWIIAANELVFIIFEAFLLLAGKISLYLTKDHEI